MYAMLALLLQAVRQAAQHAAAPVKQAVHQIIQVNPPPPPPIYVNVPPQPPGIPEWLKILISAGVGALLGILSSLLMEYLKPIISSRKIKGEAKEQVTAEVSEKVNFINSLWNYLSSSDEHTAMDDVNDIIANTTLMLSSVNRDRYVHYFEEHKAIVYSIDPKKKLFSFYKSLDAIQMFIEYRKPLGIIAATKEALSHGKNFLEDNGLEYKPVETIYDKLGEARKKGLLPGANPQAH